MPQKEKFKKYFHAKKKTNTKVKVLHAIHKKYMISKTTIAHVKSLKL